MIKRIEVFKENSFSDKSMKKFLLHDSSDFKVINFNFSPSQELPIHSHDIDGQLSIVVLEGRREFLSKDNSSFPANPGDVLIADIREPHGIRTKTNLRVLVKMHRRYDRIKEYPMKTIINEEECIGCGSCVELCPEVFQMNEDKEKAEVVMPEGGPKECIDEAIDTCPASCIHWQEE